MTLGALMNESVRFFLKVDLKRLDSSALRHQEISTKTLFAAQAQTILNGVNIPTLCFTV